MPKHYTHTIFGRPVRFEGELSYVRLDPAPKRPGGEMLYPAVELRQAKAMFPTWRLSGGRYKDGKLHPVLRQGLREFPLSRIFAWQCGHLALAHREVRVTGRPTPAFLPGNLTVSKRGAYVGLDLHEELTWRASCAARGVDPDRQISNRRSISRPAPPPPELSDSDAAGAPPRVGERDGGSPGVVNAREREA